MNNPTFLPSVFLSFPRKAMRAQWKYTDFFVVAFSMLFLTFIGVFGFASESEAYFGVLEYAPVVVGIGLWAAFPLYRMLYARH